MKCADGNCPKTATRRGLCHAHYSVCWRLVRDGLVTWAELIARSIARGERVSSLRKRILKGRQR